MPRFGAAVSAGDSPPPRPAAAATHRSAEPATRVSLLRERLAVPEISSHQVAQLGDFVLPPIEGRDVTLRGAVSILMSAYRDACSQSRTQPIAFDFV